MLDRYPINSASSIAQAIELITANIDNPTELNALGTAVEDIRLVHENIAASDRATLYRLDTSSDSVNAPYVMASATAGLRWVAIMGYAVNQMVRQNAGAQSNAYEIVANINAFSEVNIQNTNAGSATSSDLVATSSDGTSTTIYTDWGINGAGGGAAPFTAAHEAYGYTDQNVLNLGALGTSASLRLWVGATPTKIGQFDIASGISLIPVAVTTGVQTGLTYTDAANTGMTLSTEVPSINLNLSSIKQWATGALATQRFIRIQPATIAFVGGSTVTKAVTLSIGGAPIQGTNATLTTSLAIEVESGLSKFSDTTDATSSTAASVILSGGLAIAKKLNIGDSTPSTSISTGSVITAGGYSASRASFFRGVSASGDATGATFNFFSNQSVDPAAFRTCFNGSNSTSGATAGNSSFTVGANFSISHGAAVTLADSAGYVATTATTGASAVMTRAYGFYYQNSAETGTVGTKYAFYAAAVSGASANYAFFSAGAGLVSIADTTDATAIGTASTILSGGLSVAKQLRQGGNVTLSDTVTIAVGTTTGTKIGTATTQKIGFWNVTPVVQPATTGTAVGFTAGAGTAVQDVSTFTGGTGATAYRISDIVLALKQVGILAA